MGSQDLHSLNRALPVGMHVRRHKVQPLEIPGCSCRDLNSFVPSSLSLKGKVVCMHTMHSRASKEEIHLISSQRQTSTIKTLASKVARESCTLGERNCFSHRELQKLAVDTLAAVREWIEWEKEKLTHGSPAPSYSSPVPN